jgi:hypothetical protein
MIFTDESPDIQYFYNGENTNKIAVPVFRTFRCLYFSELKDRNRGMILLLIKKIKDTNNPQFIPLLRAWQFTEYKKVQAELKQAIHSLERK